MKALRARKDFRGRIRAWFDGSQGWVLVAIIGFITACIAFFVDVTENVLFDWKSGYCANGWYLSKKKCCLNSKGGISETFFLDMTDDYCREQLLSHVAQVVRIDYGLGYSERKDRLCSLYPIYSGIRDSFLTSNDDDKDNFARIATDNNG